MALPVADDDASNRRLLLIKGMYGTALMEARAPLRSFRRIIGVVTLDLANETLLKAIVWSLAAGQQIPTNFPALLKRARELVALANDEPLTSSLPGEAGVAQVHRVRNDAQHDTLVPSDEVFGDCRTHTSDFLRGVVQKVWGLDFATLAASGAIENERCRSLMVEAEKSLQERELLQAARKAKTALDWATYMATTERFGFHYLGLSNYRVSIHGLVNPLEQFSRDVEREFRSLRESLHDLALGLDDASQRRLSRMTGHRTGNLRVDKWTEPEHEIEQTDSEWAVAYCIEEIVGLEEQMGGLREPA